MKKAFVIFGSLFLLSLFLFFAFPNHFLGEKSVRKQIEAEYSKLEKEYNGVLVYLESYKKKNGIYPDKIKDDVLVKSKTFDKYNYGITNDKKGYWIEIYPKKAPIEFYYNDEHENGYNLYKNDGVYDEFLDNEKFYQINDKWHAVVRENLTRHSILFRFL